MRMYRVLVITSTLELTENHSFITDESTNSSIAAINLEDGSGIKRLFNESVVRADPKYVGSYVSHTLMRCSGSSNINLTLIMQDGHLIYCWDGDTIGYCTVSYTTRETFVAGMESD